MYHATNHPGDAERGVVNARSWLWSLGWGHYRWCDNYDQLPELLDLTLLMNSRIHLMGHFGFGSET
jgi:hypothetical protein